MNMVKQLEDMKQSMIDELKAIAANSDKKKLVCKYDRVPTNYIDVDWSIKHEGQWCKTQYNYLSADGELHTNGRGTYLRIEEQPLEILASIYDHVKNNLK